MTPSQTSKKHRHFTMQLDTEKYLLGLLITERKSPCPPFVSHLQYLVSRSILKYCGLTQLALLASMLRWQIDLQMTKKFSNQNDLSITVSNYRHFVEESSNNNIAPFSLQRGNRYIKTRYALDELRHCCLINLFCYLPVNSCIKYTFKSTY